jgi:hypothetical protein
MRRASLTIEIAAPCEAVFAVIHDYNCRLAWDTMLREARLLDGATAAGAGVRSLCVGTWRSAGLAVETEYIRFEPGRIAAVKLTNQPPLLARFAATIRHNAISAGRSRTTYIYAFRARPRCLAPLLEPLMNALLRHEVHRRLRALRSFLESQSGSGRG